MRRVSNECKVRTVSRSNVRSSVKANKKEQRISKKSSVFSLIHCIELEIAWFNLTRQVKNGAVYKRKTGMD